MKRNLLLFMALLISISISAQDLSKIEVTNVTPKTYNLEPANNIVTSQHYNPFNSRDISPKVIGSSMNFYGIYSNGYNQVMYSPETDAVVFVHRAAAGTVSPDESGELAIDFSTDKGETWTSDVHISPNMSTSNTEGRYPQVSIYAPTADIADARFVASGPSHSFYGSGSAAWGSTHHISGTITGSPSVDETYTSYISSNGMDYIGSGFEIVKSSGTAWYMLPNYVATGSTDNFTDFHMIKGTYSAGNYTWEDKYTLSPDFKVEGGNACTYDWSFTTHPSEDKAYAIINTCLNGEANDAAAPHIYETTDGGDSWNLISYLDFAPFITELEEYIIPHTDGLPIKPQVNSVDPTVDENGKIHMMCKVVPGSDQFAYYIGTVGGKTWFYGTDDEIHQLFHYYDIIYDPTADEWDMVYVAPILSQVITASWGGIEIRQHPQIARNASGSEIFCLWDDTNTRPDSLHKAPDLFEWSITSDGTTSEVTNLTGSTGAAGICFFPQFSPIIMDNGGTNEFPVVICYEVNPDATGTPDEGTANYMYLKGLSPVGVSEINTLEILIYPNPVAEKVFVSKGAKVELFNILGANLLTVEGRNDVTTIEMSKYPAGTYLLRVYTDEGIVTKKIQKVN